MSTIAPSPAPVAVDAARRLDFVGEVEPRLPDGHWAYAPDREGDNMPPAMFVGGRLIEQRFDGLNTAIRAASELSDGPRPAVAVTRDPGSRTYVVEDMVVQPRNESHPKSAIDIEGATSGRKGYVWQTLGGQRNRMVEAVVDGSYIVDDVIRYKSARPDLPGRNPDAKPLDAWKGADVGFLQMGLNTKDRRDRVASGLRASELIGSDKGYKTIGSALHYLGKATEGAEAGPAAIVEHGGRFFGFEMKFPKSRMPVPAFEGDAVKWVKFSNEPNPVRGFVDGEFRKVMGE